jgi:hypothetical protein
MPSEVIKQKSPTFVGLFGDYQRKLLGGNFNGVDYDINTTIRLDAGLDFSILLLVLGVFRELGLALVSHLGISLALAYGSNLLSRYTSVNEVSLNSISTLLGQSVVQLVGTHEVGVTVDFNTVQMTFDQRVPSAWQPADPVRSWHPDAG